MATLNSSVILACSDCTSDVLGVTAMDTIPVNGDVALKKIQLDASETEILTNQTIVPTTYNKCYIFAKNLDATATVTLGTASNDNNNDDVLDITCASLGPGEFVFMSWAGSTALVADTTHDAILELYIFETV